MNVNKSKTLAELMGLPVNHERISALSSLAAERRVWLMTPLQQLSTDALWKLVQTGVGIEFLIPIAIEHLEKDCTLRGLLTGVLMCEEFSWIEHPDFVWRLRKVIDASLAELNEWDGSVEGVIDAMRQKIPILEAAVSLERGISQLPVGPGEDAIRSPLR
jgi:hypothetical protein